MNKSAEKWLIAAVFLVIAGAVLFAVAMAGFGWDFSRLSTDCFETNTYEINDEFINVEFNTDTADVILAVSDDGTCKVICHEDEKMKHSVSVRDGKLTVNSADDRKWYEHIGISFDSPEITVCLPAKEYGSLVIRESTGDVEIPEGCLFDDIEISLSTGDVDCAGSVPGSLRIKTSTGSVRVHNASVGTLDVTVSTGDVAVSDVTCKIISSKGSTGDVLLKNVTAAKTISVERSTGSVRFDGSDSAEIFVKTSTGDVTGSLLTEKVFITETSTGSVSVPGTFAGGKCMIITSTGDIMFRIS